LDHEHEMYYFLSKKLLVSGHPHYSLFNLKRIFFVFLSFRHHHFNFRVYQLPRFHVPCSVLAFYVFSSLRRHVESCDGCAACLELFCPNNFCPPREVDRRASVLYNFARLSKVQANRKILMLRDDVTC